MLKSTAELVTVLTVGAVVEVWKIRQLWLRNDTAVDFESEGMEIIKEVAYTQAHGCRFCVQIGSTAYLFGKKKSGRGPRIEIFTPLHWFRWSSGYSK